MSNWQHATIDLGIGLWPGRRQAITWTNVTCTLSDHMASLGHNELISLYISAYFNYVCRLYKYHLWLANPYTEYIIAWLVNRISFITLSRPLISMGLLPDTLRVVHAPGTFSPPPQSSDPGMHHGTCVTHVPWCMPGSLTRGCLWSRWWGKRSRYSRRMRNPQFYVSGKRPVYSHVEYVHGCVVLCFVVVILSVHSGLMWFSYP